MEDNTYPTHPRRPLGDRRVVAARLCVDTRETERKVGFRGPAMAQRRLLYRGPHSFLEFALPSDIGGDDASWLCGQWFIQEQEAWQWSSPSVARIWKDDGGEPYADSSLDEELTFALPLAGAGDYRITLESIRGVAITMEFSA